MAVQSGAPDTSEDFVAEIVQVLDRLEAEPWLIRKSSHVSPGEVGATLLLGDSPGLVRGRLEGAGYSVRDTGLPSRDGWECVWEVRP